MKLKVFENHGQDSRYRDMGDVCETVSAKYGTGGGNQPIVCLMDQGGSVMNFEKGKTGTLRAQEHGHAPIVAYGLHPFIDNTNTATKHAGPDGDGFKKEQAFTLASMGVPKVAKCIAMSECGNDRAITEENAVDEHAVAYRVPSNASNVMKSPNPETGIRRVDISPTLDTTIPTPSKAQGGIALCSGYEVRRLMPIECERLQGMPDDWTRIPYRGKTAEECPDSPRYKAIGNSWAVPVIQWIGRRIDAAVKEQKND